MSRLPILLAALTLTLAPLHAGTAPQPVRATRASASSAAPGSPAANAIDGRIAEGSRWVSTPDSGPAWLVVEFGKEVTLSGIHLHTGSKGGSAPEDFVVQFWKGGKWQDIPSAQLRDNKAPALAIAFDATVTVTTDRLRLWITRTPGQVARVAELIAWPASAGNIPPLSSAAAPPTLVFLNQSGFNLGAPKRFTCPTLPDGTPFSVKAASGGPALFSGKLKGSIGDFSAFNPTNDGEFVVEAGTERSVPFRIGNWWLERVTYQGTVDFMVDSRHYVGNSRNPCKGSFGWRDDHHFGWELHTLVPQYLSNPSAYERMPRQVKYEAPAGGKKLWGALEPPKEDAPDIVKLMHWGADVIVTQGLLHEHMKAQLAYFLYAWPWIGKWLPQQNYDAVRDFAFAHWTDDQADRRYPYDESAGHNLLAVKTKVGSTKGSLPPGFSVEPNLLMHEVALREKRPDAAVYFDAAKKQAEWIVNHLDWNDPLTTKGQRMSEFLTITGLAHFQRMYPDRAPSGLRAKINDWTKVVIRRANNLWDFRKLDDKDGWTPMGDSPQKWNEPGNVLGLPASLLAASEVITDPATQSRLTQLVWSHFDNGFGRNPSGRHFSYDAPREIEGVEHGWYSFLPGGIGQLAEARFVIDGSPKNAHYPYHPEVGNVGWTEGWVQFNVAFNISLAYLAFDSTRIEASRAGNQVLVRLEAPLNFDYAKAETGKVVITTASGDVETVTVTEESPNSRFLTGRIPVAGGNASPGDGTVQAAAGGVIEASYGYGYLARRVRVSP